jgi:L-alanine-DL-glutamate epimerase-like enolase superfamily enzyme
MKVTRVEIFDINVPDRANWHPVLLRAYTDEGITGLGEVGLAYGTGHTAGAGMAKNLAEQLLIGRSFQDGAPWDACSARAFGDWWGASNLWRHERHDISLWDIKWQGAGCAHLFSC